MKRVVEIKNGKKAKIKDIDAWIEFTDRLALEQESVLLSSSGPCEEACMENGGVKTCGETYVICNDGELWLLET